MNNSNNSQTIGGEFTSPAPQPFLALFQRLPPDRVSNGTLQVGDLLEGENECELPVELVLGPDGQVWARVGAIENLPLRSLETRARLARRILEEFLGVYVSSSAEHAEDHPAAGTLHAWPPWQLTSWLNETADHTSGPMGALMSGVLGELAALGFRTEPARQEAEPRPGHDLQTGAPALTPVHQEERRP